MARGGAGYCVRRVVGGRVGGRRFNFSKHRSRGRGGIGGETSPSIKHSRQSGRKHILTEGAEGGGPGAKSRWEEVYIFGTFERKCYLSVTKRNKRKFYKSGTFTKRKDLNELIY